MAKKILKFTMTGVNAPDYIEKTFFQDTRKINDATRPAIGLSVDNPSSDGDGDITSLTDVETYLRTLIASDDTQPGDPLGANPDTPVAFNFDHAAKRIWYTIHPEDNTNNPSSY